jgi:hypothetical protein
MRLNLRRSPRRDWLENKDIERWIENLERRSYTTAAAYFRRLGLVCDMMNTTPEKLAIMNEKEATDFLQDMISKAESMQKKGVNILSMLKGTKSWFEFNEIYIRRRINVKGGSDYLRYEDEVIPTPEQLDRIFRAGDQRERAACALVAFGGFRPEVLGNWIGDDGLRISDLQDLEIKQGKATFRKVPAIVQVRKVVSKVGHRYFSFIPSQACDYVKEYLEWRVSELKESLTPNSPIITSSVYNPSRKRIGLPITTINISDLLRKPIRKAGFNWRPYVLRRYTDVRLMNAEADGIIIHDWRVFWMGHKGSIEATYTVNKGLPPDTIEKMRQAYKKAADKYLATGKTESSKDERLAEMRQQLLLFVKYPATEIAKMGDLSTIPQDKFEQLLDERRNEALGLNGRNSQKVVPLAEVKIHIQEGWEFVQRLPGNEAVVRLPN